MALFKKGGHSYGIASSTVIFLLSRNEDLSLKNIKTTPKWNVVSSKDLDFGGKLQQPEKWKSLKEQEKSIIFELLTLEKNNIPKSLLLNSDYIPSKYVTGGRTTMAPKNSTRVGLTGSTNKRSITLTLTVTLDGKILPFLPGL